MLVWTHCHTFGRLPTIFNYTWFLGLLENLEFSWNSPGISFPHLENQENWNLIEILLELLSSVLPFRTYSGKIAGKSGIRVKLSKVEASRANLVKQNHLELSRKIPSKPENLLGFHLPKVLGTMLQISLTPAPSLSTTVMLAIHQ